MVGMSCPRCMEASGLCAECEAYLCETRPSYAPIEDPESRIHFLCAVSVASLRRLLGPDFDKHIVTERVYDSATASEQLDLLSRNALGWYPSTVSSKCERRSGELEHGFGPIEHLGRDFDKSFVTARENRGRRTTRKWN